MLFFLPIRGPPRSTRPDTLLPYTTLFRALLTRDRSALSCHSFCRRLGHRGVGAGSALRPDVDSAPRAVALPEEQSVGTDFPRSAERRVGKECVSTFRSRWSPVH